MPRICRSGFAPWSNFFSHIQDKIRRSSPRVNRRHPTVRLARAAGYGVETMEQRLLFTVITGSGTLEYFDNNLNTIRVAFHDVTADLIFVTVDPVSDVASETTQVLPSDPPPAQGANLFTIDITQSNLDSYISIAKVPAITVTGPRPMDPFAGDAGPFAVNDAQGVSTTLINFSPPAGSGVALLGAVHNGVLASHGGPAVGQPIITVPFAGPGSTGGILTAGVYMTATDPLTTLPNDMGEFLFGGTIFGNISFPAPAAGTVAPAPASQGGNVGLFYAGCILTGNANGILEPVETSAGDQTPNFIIGGDLRDLITSGPIGGDPVAGTIDKTQYLTGFDASVAGTVSEIFQREGGFFGAFNIQHNPAIFGLPASLLTETQWQFHVEKGAKAGDIFQGLATGTPKLPAPFDIGNATTPQYLGSIAETDPTTLLPIRDTNGNIIYQSTVSATFQGFAGDTSNYYSVPLLAGQTITISPNTGQFLQTQLIDPDGRVVASDENLRQPSLTLDAPFQYTADRPGEYEILVTNLPGLVLTTDLPYTLTIDGVGDMGLGTLAAPGGNIFDGGFDEAFLVGHGDLGAMIAGDTIFSATLGPTPNSATITPPSTITVPAGNLRALKGASIGSIVASGTATLAAEFGGGSFLDVPNGTVGLVKATSAAGVLFIQTRFNLLSPNGDTPFSAVGGDFQMIDGAGTVGLDIATNQAIGVIRAGDMATVPASFIDVNADNTGSDGIIDLIDCVGDFGTLNSGGPGIVTHDGGNVRYIRVEGTVFQDAFFGGGEPTQTLYQMGESATITDDSGATAVLSPIGPTTIIMTTDPNNPAQTITTTTGAQLNLTTYGIRDKGGVVIIDATVDDPLAPTTTTGTVTTSGSAAGLNITSSGPGGANSHVEIGRIEIRGEGQEIDLATNTNTGRAILDTNGEQTLAPLPVGTTATGGTTTTTTTTSTTPPTLSLNITGSADVDVLSVIAVQETTSLSTFADVTSIINNTPGGEITSILAHSIGTITSLGTVGLAKHNTPEIVNPSEQLKMSLTLATPARPRFGNRDVVAFPVPIDIGNLYPWVQQSIGVVALWNIMSITAGQGLGNIAVNGSIGTITANAMGKPTPGSFAGINAPISASDFSPALPVPALAGRILQVNIGQGILPSGSGSVGMSGLYATGAIGTVTNHGLAQSDIRGNVVSDTQIDNISLSNGSIINAGILVIGGFDEASPLGPGIVVPGTQQAVTNPTFEVRKINISGNGGMIGANVIAANIGPVTVSKQGFGILESDFAVGGAGVIGKISAGGYGIRGTSFSGGAGLQALNATGNGSEVPVSRFSSDVRQSESSVTFDPFFGIAPNKLTDLDAYLGTTAAAPVIKGVTDSGVIEDVVAVGSTFLGSITAQTIRVSAPLFVPTPAPFTAHANIPVPGEAFATEFNFANSIGSITVRGSIDGMQITTGRLGSFHQGGSVSRCGISVAGAIQSLTIRGNFGQTITDPATGNPIPDSYIMATGPDGVIKNLKITGSLFGNVTATGNIGRVNIGGDLLGSITIQGSSKGLALGYLRIGGAIQDSSLTVNGDAGSIITNGSLGSSTGTLTVAGSVKLLSVGASHKQSGSSLASALHVEGTLQKLLVHGRIDGAVTVDGDLGNLQIVSDGTTGNILNGNVSVGGRLGTAKIIGGNVNADITSNGSINAFTVTRGSVLAGHTIQSLLESIKKFRITGGSSFGLFGSLLAPNGTDEQINISGNFGDGVDPASITAFSGTNFRIGGSILSNTTIAITDALNLLQVNGDIDAGATVSAHPLKKLKVGGQTLGSVTTV
jgi:hypothetical protein